jgi:flagellar FliL protein
MIRTLLPILLLLIGTGAGVGAGVFLRPTQAPAPHAEPTEGAETHGEDTGHGAEAQPAFARGNDADGPTNVDYVKMNNQFVIPVVEDGAVSSVVLLALSIEVETGHRDVVILREPKLRDSFLQVLFDHANVGGFRGSFTDNSNLDVLRAALREVAVRDTGSYVTDVLIHDIARQDY